MKIRIFLLALMSTLTTGLVLAQDIENDDMYFNSADRAKLSATRGSSIAMASNRHKSDVREEEDDSVNPTDSYSARNVNPEYTSRTQSQASQADDENYFVNNYKYNTQSNLSKFNNNYNNWYNNPWYSSAYYGSGINSWNSPYYGSYYDAWGSPWANPYYRSGWSSSFSYFWGSNYNYGWGMNYGYGMGWGNPYNSWASMYGPSYGWGYPYYGNSWYGGYPTQVIVVDNGSRGPIYGKRGTRSANYINRTSGTSGGRQYTNAGSGSRSDNGARTRTSRQSDYYQRTWRSDSQNSNSGYSNSGYGNSSGGRMSSQPSQSSWRSSGSNSNSSWGGSSSGGASRSSGGSYGGGSHSGGGGGRSSRGGGH
jgi:hypothetical protein